jgi:hypothetical protein
MSMPHCCVCCNEDFIVWWGSTDWHNVKCIKYLNYWLISDHPAALLHQSVPSHYQQNAHLHYPCTMRNKVSFLITLHAQNYTLHTFWLFRVPHSSSVTFPSLILLKWLKADFILWPSVMSRLWFRIIQTMKYLCFVTKIPASLQIDNDAIWIMCCRQKCNVCVSLPQAKAAYQF